MNSKISKLSILTLLFVIATGNLTEAFATVVIATSFDPDLLAAALVGPGVTIVAGTPSFVGSAISAGTFTGGASAGLGIASGIILTSGDATLAPGPNVADSSSGLASGAGDADLDAEFGGGTTDTTVLEFDFETTTGDLFFRYQFASEEYNEFAFTPFNDVFAFFLDGTNIALVPPPAVAGTLVSIDTVNCGNPFNPPASGNNCSLYNNNDLQDGCGGLNPPCFDIEYDGFTDVFTASVLGLSAGTHHIKLAISDRTDTVWDSAVFLEGSSFSSTNPNNPIGGEIIPIDSAALLLAGIQSNTSSILTVFALVGMVAFGAIFYKAKMKN